MHYPYAPELFSKSSLLTLAMDAVTTLFSEHHIPPLLLRPAFLNLPEELFSRNFSIYRYFL